MFYFKTVFFDLPGKKFFLAGTSGQSLSCTNINMLVQHCFLVQQLIEDLFWKGFGQLNSR